MLGKTESKKKPAVSIIIATYNKGAFIKKAIESVLGQSYKQLEIIIIDDGSTDNTKKIVSPYLQAGKIKYIYQKNSGSAVARNRGIKFAQGKYIAILDSDDFWVDKQKLEKQVNFLEKNSEYSLVGGGMIIINKKGKKIGKYIPPETDNDIRKLILIKNPFAHSTVLFRKDKWELTKGYISRQISSTDEWSLWLEMGKLGKFYNFREVFVNYLRSEKGSSKQNLKYNLKADIEIRKKYHFYYPNFWKGYIYGWFQYFYFFFPFKKQLFPIVSRLKRTIFNYSIRS